VPTPYKIVFDCSDPHLLAGFWAAALGWVVEDNSPLISRLMNVGAVDPDDEKILAKMLRNAGEQL
jgi:hypothetical protein